MATLDARAGAGAGANVGAGAGAGAGATANEGRTSGGATNSTSFGTTGDAALQKRSQAHAHGQHRHHGKHPAVLSELDEGLWVYGTPFRFFGVASIGNNGLIVKCRAVGERASGEHVLVAVNGPALSEELLGEIKALERRESARVAWVIGTDWQCAPPPGTARARAARDARRD